MPEHTGDGEILEQQTQLDTEPDRTPMFSTDEQIAERLQRAENTATDLEYRAGVLKRELGAIRTALHPESQ